MEGRALGVRAGALFTHFTVWFWCDCVGTEKGMVERKMGKFFFPPHPPDASLHANGGYQTHEYLLALIRIEI